VTDVHRQICHEKNIKDKQFQQGDWALLYDSQYKDFKGKLRTRWLGPYVIEKCHDNHDVHIRNIDAGAIPLLVNGYRLNIYKKPFQRNN